VTEVTPEARAKPAASRVVFFSAMQSNRQRIEKLERDLEQLQRTVWNQLALLTGSSGEDESAGLIRLRLALAKDLRESDPTL
jgi:hypothetical protein